MKEGNKAFLNHLLSIQKRKFIREDEAFEYFYELTKRKIQARAENNVLEYLMIIPSFTTGLPIYDNKKLASRIQKKIEKDGLMSVLTQDVMIYINWSPNALAVLDKANVKKKAKKHTKKIKQAKKETKDMKVRWGI